MADSPITIDGLDQVRRLLGGVPTRILHNAIERALDAAAVPVAQELTSRTPEVTGDLKNHLVTVVAVNEDAKEGTAQVGFGSEGYIARLVELGHRDVGHKPDKKELALGMVSPHPFMRPAADAAKEAAIQAFADSLTESISEGTL